MGRTETPREKVSDDPALFYDAVVRYGNKEAWKRYPDGIVTDRDVSVPVKYGDRSPEQDGLIDEYSVTAEWCGRKGSKNRARRILFCYTWPILKDRDTPRPRLGIPEDEIQIALCALVESLTPTDRKAPYSLRAGEKLFAAITKRLLGAVLDSNVREGRLVLEKIPKRKGPNQQRIWEKARASYRRKLKARVNRFRSELAHRSLGDASLSADLAADIVRRPSRLSKEPGAPVEYRWIREEIDEHFLLGMVWHDDDGEIKGQWDIPDSGRPNAEQAIGISSLRRGRAKTAKFLSVSLRMLRPEYQKAIHLRYWENRTQNEIAAELDVSQDSVSRYLSDALDKLRYDFEPQAGINAGMIPASVAQLLTRGGSQCLVCSAWKTPCPACAVSPIAEINLLDEHRVSRPLQTSRLRRRISSTKKAPCPTFDLQRLDFDGNGKYRCWCGCHGEQTRLRDWRIWMRLLPPIRLRGRIVLPARFSPSPRGRSANPAAGATPLSQARYMGTWRAKRYSAGLAIA